MFWKMFDNGVAEYYLSSDLFNDSLPNDSIDPRWFEEVDFHGIRGRARNFLNSLLTCSQNETRLRQLAWDSFKARHLCAGNPWRLESHEFRHAFLECLLAKCFRVVLFRRGEEGRAWLKSLPPDPSLHIAKQTQPVIAPPALGWVEFQLVWDDTRAPIDQMELEVETLDKKTHSGKSNPSGILRLENLERGACKVSTKIPQGMTVAECVVLAGLGENKVGQHDEVSNAPHSPGPKSQKKHQRNIPKAIIVLESRKVKSGETLKTIANQVGMQWDELAYFNWGTKDPGKINEYLVDEVGCTKKNGDEYTFEDDNSPGIIYLPKQWQASGMVTGTRNIIRLAKLKALHLELANDDAVPLPEVCYELKFSDQTRQTGRVGKNGKALILYSSALKYEVDYPDALDLRAKDFAASIRKEFEKHETERLFKLLAKKEELIKATMKVYNKYFNTHTGKGFMEDVYQEVTDPSALFVLEGVMELLGFETRRSARSVASKEKAE